MDDPDADRPRLVPAMMDGGPGLGVDDQIVPEARQPEIACELGADVHAPARRRDDLDHDDRVVHLDRIAARHPGLKLVIDHVGISVRGKAPHVFEELPAVCALAKHPNVAVKASGMPSLSAQPYPFRDLHDAIHRLVDAFGPKRTFWGTDLTRMPCTYYECIMLFTQHLPWLKGEDLEWVMGRGVCEWLGWPLTRA